MFTRLECLLDPLCNGMTLSGNPEFAAGWAVPKAAVLGAAPRSGNRSHPTDQSYGLGMLLRYSLCVGGDRLHTPRTATVLSRSVRREARQCDLAKFPRALTNSSCRYVHA